jgi:hypothetical protein
VGITADNEDITLFKERLGVVFMMLQSDPFFITFLKISLVDDITIILD